MERVSVVIPTYDQGHFFAEAINRHPQRSGLSSELWSHCAGRAPLSDHLLLTQVPDRVEQSM
jgi:hypothetical protein